jgi:hypothetical protein
MILEAISYAFGGALVIYGLFERARMKKLTPKLVTVAKAEVGRYQRVVGQIVDGGTLVAPITGRACVSFDAVILEDGPGRKVVTRGLRGTPFIVDDGSGKILVDPRGAYIQVVYDKTEVGRFDTATVADPDLLEGAKGHPGNLRFDEGVLAIGEQVTVTGMITQVSGAEDDPVYRRLAATELRIAGAPDRPAIVSERPDDLR